MSTLGEIERLATEYERRIRRLKDLEGQLRNLDTKGFENEVERIRKRTKDPRSLEWVEQQLIDLKQKIKQKKEIQTQREREREREKEREKTLQKERNIITNRPEGLYQPASLRHFPYELSPDYTDVGLIGKGGFARVFRANRIRDGKEVAVKIPISMDRSVGKSFIKEMENWTRLRHQNIVEIFDFNVLPIPYFEMELCETPLEKMQTPCEIEKAAWIVFNIAEGLKYAHNNRIVHRDIKPQNILLKKGIPKISDWGLSKITAEGRTSTTAAATLTLSYAAPEQISKKFGSKDQQTDIWQLGVIFYELVTGKLPFSGDDMAEKGFNIVTEPFIPPSEINPKAKKVEEVIKKCLEKQKEKRYKTMIDLQKDLAKMYEYHVKLEDFKKDSTKTMYLSGELFIINMKIGAKKDAYKYATDMIKYAPSEVKDELKKLCEELKERIEENLEISEQLIEKADILMHKIKVSKK
jgi:serine/threonine protein kinase